MNWLSVKIEELESAADTGIASQSTIMALASDLKYLVERAIAMGSVPDQTVTDAHVQMVIDSHEKGHAMIVPCKIDYALAKEVQTLRRAANPVTRDEDAAWWKQEAEDCKARLLELAKENEDLRRSSEITRDEAIAKFREWNIGFPVERFKADYVIRWVLFHYPPAPVAIQNFRTAMEGIGHIRRTLEETFGGLHGTHCEPDTLAECKAICDAICSAYRQSGPEVVPEHHQHLSELYHAQEKRLFKLAQSIKGPSFDKYAHSPSQAIDVLETAVFGQQPTNGKSELLQRAEKLAEDTAALACRVATSDCTWRYDDEEHSWDGECGASWTFFEDGPKENSMHFCPGCGKPVAVQPD